MEHQTVGSYTHGQHMIGEPLVQQVVGRLPVLVRLKNIIAAVLLVVEYPLLYILAGNVGRFFPDYITPDIVSLGKYGKAKVAMFRGVGSRMAGCSVEYPSEGSGIKVGDKAFHVHLAVFEIFYNTEGIF